MDPKDYIAIGAAVISACSLTVSYITWRQKSSEAERTIRNQITDVIGKLDAVFAEGDKLNFENSDKRNDPYFVGRRSFLNGQKRFLARQALDLMNYVRHLVTDFEYNRVADAFCSIGDFGQANDLYIEAIKSAKQDNYKANCTRAYARCLFVQSRVEEGREQFQDAVALVSPDNDVNRFHIAETYQRWAMVEADSHNWAEAAELIKKAREVYLRIIGSRPRGDGLANLEHIENSISARQQNVLVENSNPPVREISSPRT
jgi:tetratricopeptide (TPR) repeat protein